jgi:hypothetical protein
MRSSEAATSPPPSTSSGEGDVLVRAHFSNLRRHLHSTLAATEEHHHTHTRKKMSSPPRTTTKRTSPPQTPKKLRRNSRAASVFIVLACTLVGCIFFPLFVTLTFIIILNRKVRESLSTTNKPSSDLTILIAQVLSCVPFYFAGPIVLTICAGVQILFSAYHSAASEFLLIAFCIPFLFTSPWWGSWWYVTYIPMSIAVPICFVLWKQVRATISNNWQKWSYEKGRRAAIVVNLNAFRYHVHKMLAPSHKFPVVRYLKKFLQDQFAS